MANITVDNPKHKEIADSLGRSLPVIQQICNDDARLMLSVLSCAIAAVLMDAAKDPIGAVDRIAEAIKANIVANMEAGSVQ